MKDRLIDRLKDWLKTATIVAGASALLAATGVASLGAQTGASGGRIGQDHGPGADVPIFMIPALLAADRKLAVEGQEKMLEQFRTWMSPKNLYVMKKVELDDILRGSGFPTDTALSDVDAYTLAKQLRADLYLDAEVAKLPNAFQFSGTVVLGENMWVRDPIPKPVARTQMTGAAKEFYNEFAKVWKQMPHALKCFSLVRQAGKLGEAEAAARAGIAAYPDAIAARTCLGLALANQEKSPDEIIGVAEEILKRDANARVALGLAIDASQRKADTTQYVAYASRFVALDPAAPQVELIVQNLADWKRSDVALPFITQALAVDPENKELLKLQFRLLIGANRLKEAAASGAALATIDTAYADTTFYSRMAAIFLNDSQPEKAAEWLARGVQKFPTNMALVMAYAQQLKNIGQIPQAIGVYTQILVIQPKSPEIRLRIADFYNQLGQPDSALHWLREAKTAGDDSVQISGTAKSIGGKLITAAGQTKSPDDYKKAVVFMAFADSAYSDDQTRFYWGLAAYNIGAIAVQRMQPPATPTCALVKEAQEWLPVAFDKVRAGGRADADNAAKILGVVQQLIDHAEHQFRTLRCS